ncbi:hypothetical protein KAR91_86245 [Candidatus Pacearchaeota archaeon]|nr:hypothetical protein [Candidatus Pacearchaeota archaeon]
MNNPKQKNSKEKEVFSKLPSEFYIGLPFCNWKTYINTNQLLRIAFKKMARKRLTKTEDKELKKFYIFLGLMMIICSTIGCSIAIISIKLLGLL